MALNPRIGATGAALIAGALGLSLMPLLISAGIQACAHVEAPRGGPPDTIPPFVVSVEPDTFAVVPGFEDDVRFVFNESISERAIQGTVIIFPFEARPRLKKGKDNLRVRPLAGWVEGRIYHINIEPAIQDLFGNSMAEPVRYVFSTGPPIPANQVQGIVYDRITNRPLRSGRVDMVHLADTTRYGVATDSIAEFRLGALPLGDYLAIGYEDLNNNRQADAFDRSDTLSVSISSSDTLALEFEVFRHDTAGPQIVEVRSVDSIVFDLEFDGYLDPDADLFVDSVDVRSLADGQPIVLDTLLHGWQYDSWRRARAETARAAAAAAAADTADAPEPADTLVPPAAALDTLAPTPLDSLEDAQQEPALEAVEPEPLPQRRVIVVSEAPIPPGSYVVRVRGLLNLSGLSAESEGALEQPEEESEQDEEPGGKSNR